MMFAGLLALKKFQHLINNHKLYSKSARPENWQRMSTLRWQGTLALTNSKVWPTVLTVRTRLVL